MTQSPAQLGRTGHEPWSPEREGCGASTPPSRGKKVKEEDLAVTRSLSSSTQSESGQNPLPREAAPWSPKSLCEPASRSGLMFSQLWKPPSTLVTIPQGLSLSSSTQQRGQLDRYFLFAPKRERERERKREKAAHNPRVLLAHLDTPSLAWPTGNSGNCQGFNSSFAQTRDTRQVPAQCSGGTVHVFAFAAQSS